MRWGKACLSIDPERGGAPVTSKVVFQKGKATCLPGYNLLPVPEAWNRSGSRRRGVIILKLPYGYKSLYYNVNANAIHNYM